MRKMIFLSLLVSSCSTFSKLSFNSDKKEDRIRIVDNDRSPASVNYFETPSYEYQSVEGQERLSYNPLDNKKVEEQTGSLWNSNGQKSFLFTTNLQKNVGDLVTIKLEDSTKKQLSDEYESVYLRNATKKSRTKYLDKLLDDKDEYSKEEVKKLMFKSAKFSEKLLKVKRAPASTKKRIFSSDEITARVIGIASNGSYRIQGVQRLVVNKKPYKLVLAGLIRPSDINPDDSVISTKIVDSKIKFYRARS